MTQAPRTSSEGPGPDSEFGAELELALETARAAGRLQLERYEQLVRIDPKGSRDIVTEVDYASEALILTTIRSRFPDDGLLAEESGEHRQGVAYEAAFTAPESTDAADATGALPVATSERGRVWVVDPLDGTINYANGIPFYCVSIALADGGRPVVGVVHDPSRDETFWATADGPALLDGRPIEVGDKTALGELVVTMAIGGRGMVGRRRRLLRSVRASRSLGSAALTLSYVANGRFDAYGQGAGLSAWDVAAAGLIAERAGARVTDLGGGAWFDLARPAKRWSLLAASPAHHERLLELLRDGAVERIDPEAGQPG